MLKLVSFVAGLVGIFWMAIAGYWWDAYRPAGWPNYTLSLGPFHHTFALPDGYGAKYRALLEQEVAAGLRGVQVEKAEAVVTSKAQAAEVKAQTQIRTVTQTIIREVPTYVSPTTDRAFPLSVGFVRALDAGAAGDVSAPPPAAIGTFDTASPVAPSVVAVSVDDDFGICRANAERLGAWQSWWAQVNAAAKAP